MMCLVYPQNLIIIKVIIDEPVYNLRRMGMRTDKFEREGLTFDDVLLLPAMSEVLPRDVKLSTKLSTNLELKAPFISAGMDTVTEADMDRKSTRLNSSHVAISYAVFCLKKKIYTCDS